MGILSNVGKFLTKNPIGQKITRGLDTLSGVVTNPLTAIKKGTGASTAAFQAATPAQNVFKTITNVGLTAATVAGLGQVAGLTRAGTLGATVGGGVVKGITATGGAIGKSFVSHPISTAAAGLIGAPLVFGALSKKPEVIIQAPKAAYESGQKIVDLITDHPVASAVIGGVTGGVAAYEGYKYLFPDTATSKLPSTQTLPAAGIAPATAISTDNMAAASPQTAATQTLTKTKAKSTKRRHKKRKSSNLVGKTQIINIKDTAGRDTYNFGKV